MHSPRKTGASNSAKSSVPDIDPEIVRRFCELLVKRRDEVALENLPETTELAAEIKKVVAEIARSSAATKG